MNGFRSKLLLLLFTLFSIGSCSHINSSQSSSKDDTVAIKFLQYGVDVEYRHDEGTHVLVFDDNLLAENALIFNKGQKLSQEEIFELQSYKKLNYVVPPLEQGYFTFTFFYFDKDLPRSENQLTPDTVITDHLIYYFGIIG
ncbi:MAG: hypothetical protein RBS24_03725 [Bacilli bacterium]|nr:hypothetical protein [Bacilli bacterium]